MKKTISGKEEKTNAFDELEHGIFAALETYSNVHRGSGHNSIVTTHLYEQAREIVLEFLGLEKAGFTVIFCSKRESALLLSKLEPGSFQCISSNDFGLSMGVSAIAAKRNSLKALNPVLTGGGTASLISNSWVIWAGIPDRFEPGTPAIINIIAFAGMLKLVRKYGNDIFRDQGSQKMSSHDILYNDELGKYSGQELLDELRKTLIGRNILVPTMEGSKPFINLDNSASTPTFTPVWDAFRLTLRQPAEVQREIINEVRSLCSGFLGAPANKYDVIFTSNTTEAINIAVESLSLESGPDETIVVNTILEHSSNDLPWRENSRITLIRISADNEGFIDLIELEKILIAYNREELHGKKRIKLFAVTGASNVLGTYNDLAEISRIVHKYGARLLIDAAQLIAHHNINMEESGIDYLAFSAHKIYAPFGSGGLVVKKDLLKFSPSEMEEIHLSGEENPGGIAALGKVIILFQRIGMELIREEEQSLTSRALLAMARMENIRVFGIKDPLSPRFSQKGGIIVFELKGTISSSVAKDLAEKGGIGIRYGCHCSHILIKHLLGVSPSLERFQRIMLTVLPKVKLPGLARISFGIGNIPEDVDNFINVLSGIPKKSETGSDIKPVLLSHAQVKKQIKEFTLQRAGIVYRTQ